MNAIAFYHIACMGHWREIVLEQLRILARTGFDGLIRVTFLGAEKDWEFVAFVADQFNLKIVRVFRSENLRDFEAPALRELDAVCRAGYEGAVLYFHTKGASMPGHPNKTYWRWLMNVFMLSRWRTCVEDLETHDIAGVCWEDCEPRSHFCGNFWWARSDWILKLHPFDSYYRAPWYDLGRKDPEFERRYACEQWISSNVDRGLQRRIKSYHVTNAHIWKDEFWLTPAGFTARALALLEGS